MSSKKHRKKLKRLHLIANSKINLRKKAADFIKTIEENGIEAEKAAKNFMNFISDMEILKVNLEDDFIICESCTKQCTDIDSMSQDDDSNWFCPECWEELAPTMRKIYEELKANGEIE